MVQYGIDEARALLDIRRNEPMTSRTDPSTSTRSLRRWTLVVGATLIGASTLLAQDRARPRVESNEGTVDARSSANAEPATRSELRIVSSPRACAVYVDGVRAGVVDDFDGIFQSLSLAPGRHEIAFYLEGFHTARHRVYLAAGSTLTIRPRMELIEDGEPSALPASPAQATCGDSPADLEPAVVGRLALRVIPGSATVTVDGEVWSSSSEGRFEFELPIGSHVVRAWTSDHESFSRRVTITEGATTSLRVRLARLAKR